MIRHESASIYQGGFCSCYCSLTLVFGGFLAEVSAYRLSC
jgi:hypothetical protein